VFWGARVARHRLRARDELVGTKDSIPDVRATIERNPTYLERAQASTMGAGFAADVGFGAPARFESRSERGFSVISFELARCPIPTMAPR
jgi:hypothetical protein